MLSTLRLSRTRRSLRRRVRKYRHRYAIGTGRPVRGGYLRRPGTHPVHAIRTAHQGVTQGGTLAVRSFGPVGLATLDPSASFRGAPIRRGALHQPRRLTGIRRARALLVGPRPCRHRPRFVLWRSALRFDQVSAPSTNSRPPVAVALLLAARTVVEHQVGPVQPPLAVRQRAGSRADRSRRGPRVGASASSCSMGITTSAETPLAAASRGHSGSPRRS